MGAPAAISDARTQDAPQGQEGFLTALQAVQELREKNLRLREGNAEIVEELLQNEGLMTPSSLADGPTLLDRSQASSCNATPSAQRQPTAQFTGSTRISQLGISTRLVAPSTGLRPSITNSAGTGGTMLSAGRP